MYYKSKCMEKLQERNGQKAKDTMYKVVTKLLFFFFYEKLRWSHVFDLDKILLFLWPPSTTIFAKSS